MKKTEALLQVLQAVAPSWSTFISTYQRIATPGNRPRRLQVTVAHGPGLRLCLSCKAETRIRAREILRRDCPRCRAPYSAEPGSRRWVAEWIIEPPTSQDELPPVPRNPGDYSLRDWKIEADLWILAAGLEISPKVSDPVTIFRWRFVVEPDAEASVRALAAAYNATHPVTVSHATVGALLRGLRRAYLGKGPFPQEGQGLPPFSGNLGKCPSSPAEMSHGKGLSEWT